MLWNANKIENKIDEVYLSLDTNNIDILAINETKLDSVGENFICNHPAYTNHFKSRNKFGGGIGFIIRKNLEFEVISDLDQFNVEVICVKIKI